MERKRHGEELSTFIKFYEEISKTKDELRNGKIKKILTKYE